MARLSRPPLRRRETRSEHQQLLDELTDRPPYAAGNWAAVSETLDAIVALGAPGIDALTGALSNPDRRLRSVVAEYLQPTDPTERRPPTLRRCLKDTRCIAWPASSLSCSPAGRCT